MARLFHFPLDPLCRRIRLALAEYGRDAELVEERPWEGRAEFLDRNPAGLLPIFEDDDGTQAAGIEAVGEYLDETRASRAAAFKRAIGRQVARVGNGGRRLFSAAGRNPALH